MDHNNAKLSNFAEFKMTRLREQIVQTTAQIKIIALSKIIKSVDSRHLYILDKIATFDLDIPFFCFHSFRENDYLQD